MTFKYQRCQYFVGNRIIYVDHLNISSENTFKFNPFDMEHKAKIAVKFGILRVVMLWPS